MFPLNVPNVLTVVRILLVPVLVAALLVETRQGATIAAVVFAIAAITDGLDGYIARSRRSVTTFGKVMDPIADKLLITAALIALVSLDRVAAWVQALVYLSVFTTVASGVDYFLNVRREIDQARDALRTQRLRSSPTGDGSRSSSSSREVPRM